MKQLVVDVKQRWISHFCHSTFGVPLHPVTSWHSIRMCQNPLKASVTLIQTHVIITYLNTSLLIPTLHRHYTRQVLLWWSALVGSDGYLHFNPHLFVFHSLPVRSRSSSSFILLRIVVEVIRLLTPAISFSILCCLLSSSVTCSVGWKSPLVSITQLLIHAGPLLQGKD